MSEENLREKLMDDFELLAEMQSRLKRLTSVPFWNFLPVSRSAYFTLMKALIFLKRDIEGFYRWTTYDGYHHLGYVLSVDWFASWDDYRFKTVEMNGEIVCHSSD